MAKPSDSYKLASTERGEGGGEAAEVAATATTSTDDCNDNGLVKGNCSDKDTNPRPST